ncbi:13744_t:CDS:2, partial [Acaulospora morrowiae]
ACGTVRTNSAKFPKELKVGKTLSLDWNTLSGKVINDVLVTLWIDNGPVTMLTTIHKINGDEWKVICNRRRPRETSSNANMVYQVFGNASRKELAIPKIIDDYNHYMGGVDIADQLRGYYNCQLTVRRTCTLNDINRVETRNQSSAAQDQTQLKLAYVTKNFELPVSRLLPGEHFPEWREKRA